ncbi:MAG: N-terminal C2 in EEIG1 and EHBP1 proteins-domain-containing protein [Benjaminiella poitrasii]|nr:MAG: N-terminal C2 in EEIG1 and EHBP1 proteins-domain-containing protein [Benjaminiella poitrasii]
MSPFKHLFISKSRKVNFELSIIIRDLVNIPLVSGYYYVNWKLKNASHTTGTTERVHIKNHQVIWNYPINTIIQLIIDKQQVLGSCELKLEIYQKGGKEIGSLSINLSEYAGLGVTTERYLLQNCKFNSTIELTLRMNIKTESTPNPQFQTPPLSRKQIFKDIPTVISERKERNKKVTNSPTTPLRPNIRQSQSVMSLPRFCKIQSTEEPSPIDVVEKLFAMRVEPL